jgi:predicted DCC family thiol-disulfide oxidoreductase YuxK
MAKRKSISVFYDGGCVVCDSEIRVYREISRDSGIEFVNISAPDFSAEKYGKSRDEFMQALHVRDAAGEFHVGVDAFRLLWKTLPGAHYQMLAAITGLPGINLFSRIGYRLFAENRHRLPRK